MPTRDFSRPPAGRRLRLILQLYKPDTRQFGVVKGVGALVTVRNAVEQRRLWQAIEQAIERGEWRLPDAEAGADSDRVGFDGDRVAVGS